ncbi:D-glycero-beta-D-manno-heptose 1,7-bisphosphate 7-phosphatase [Paraferrimonas sedimenticola]|uniref:D,D-heptose 1,7-bisphosphate phosphatase n=1 Tax=Paraferrimonas sedimenticola TaxID=375674 RepID=A0AA37RWN2_9GAMM|nr:D-glycero-beta-D-manno-heptose 1,7-bisphosphate 7-phosphatase [Paraferrimonas sedimenticola]GLP96558.1 D,D-heptose 1,7-bisphosphate phosphatase [Paraferrimonas sedimenticola]
MKKAIFLDRDGVINKDLGYVARVDDFHFIEGVFEACRQLKDMGYLLVLVTNQSGIARGYYSEVDFHTLTEWMDWNFVDKGVEFDGIYFCPHHPTKGKGDYLQDCDCRKPKPGMFNSAQEFLKIDMSQSVVLGDKLSDLQAGEAAGVAIRVLALSGQELSEAEKAQAPYTVKSIAELPSFLKSL